MDIDLVVTWVDGNDPVWRKQRAQYAQDKEHSSDFYFRDWQLLRYWFRGVEANLPWVRKIHFVTWGHLPAWLNCSHPKINIVRHEDFIPKQYLPTFNSITLSQNLHRIEGLSEHFVYANDDTYFISPMLQDDYFQKGFPCDVLSLRPITEIGDVNFGHIMWNDVSCINRHFQMSECLARDREKWFHPSYTESIRQQNQAFSQLAYFPGFGWDHYPNAYLKSTFERVWEKEYYRLNETCSHRFRELFDMNEWVMRYWQLAEGNFTPRMPTGCASCSVTDSPEKLRNVLLSGENRIVCLNDGIGEVDFESRSAYLQRLFETILPTMSSFELF